MTREFYPGDCPKCDRTDYGWDLPDTRSTLYVPCSCGADDCADCCPAKRITIAIVRVWDRECSFCGEPDWRPTFEVREDGRLVAVVPSENAAHAVIAEEYPNAEPDNDPAWDSEAPLRAAGG